VQYYYPAQQSCGGGGGGSGGGGGGSGQPQTKGGPPIGPDQFEGDYHEYGRYLHNWYRKRHGAPPLAMVERLNRDGDQYCAYLAPRRTLVHSTGRDYGENLYMSTDTSLSKKGHVRKACELWYGEIKDYNWNYPGFSMATGHFTAMVWKSSTQLGIGFAQSNGCIIVAGCYKVHPNMQGDFPKNVLKWRAVEDTDDEGSDSEEEKKQPEKAASKEVENEEKPKDTTKKEKDSDKLPPEAESLFASKGNIGWEELSTFLNANVKVAFKFPEGFDKTICALLITVATSSGKGLKERVDKEEFNAILECIGVVLDAYGESDQDGSGTLDPFELKEALTEAGFSISYKMFLTLHSALCQGQGEGATLLMNFRSFFLTFLLLLRLKVVQKARDEKRAKGQILEDFSLKEWIHEQLEALNSF
jgi:hypothetical protein